MQDHPQTASRWALSPHGTYLLAITAQRHASPSPHCVDLPSSLNSDEGSSLLGCTGRPSFLVVHWTRAAATGSLAAAPLTTASFASTFAAGLPSGAGQPLRSSNRCRHRLGSGRLGSPPPGGDRRTRTKALLAPALLPCQRLWATVHMTSTLARRSLAPAGDLLRLHCRRPGQRTGVRSLSLGARAGDQGAWRQSPTRRGGRCFSTVSWQLYSCDAPPSGLGLGG